MSRSLSLFLAGSLIGCATTVEPYPTRSPDSLSVKEERSALTVGAAPLMNARESKKYFGADLPDAEIAPVLIAVRNDSTDASYLLLEDHISLSPVNASKAASRADHGVGSDGVATGTQVAGIALTAASVAFPPLVLVAIPVLLTGSSMSVDREAVQGQLVINSLRSTTLSPGSQTQGFVFFDRKDVSKGNTACVVTVELTRLEDGSVERFELPVSFKEFP